MWKAYGWTIIKKLPTGNFRWLSESEIEEFTQEKISELVNKSKGYVLEVDVKYPQHLHEYHNDLPFMPESMKIKKVEKLTPNLNDKIKYVINIEALN